MAKSLFRRGNNRFSNAQCYLSALEVLSRQETSDICENIRLYGFIMDKLKIDIAAEAQLDFLLHPHLHDNTKCFLFFPEYDYSYEIPKSIATKEYIEVNLSSDIVVASVRKIVSLMKHNAARDEQPFCMTASHTACYYSYIDLCIIRDGIHSISSAIYKKQGKVTARVYDLTLLFGNIYTDGEKWYSKSRRQALGLVRDYRYALLFEVANRKFALEQAINQKREQLVFENTKLKAEITQLQAENVRLKTIYRSLEVDVNEQTK